MKVIFLVGDAPPAQREAEWNFKNWSKQARERHIVVNTVRCGGDDETAKAWKYAAKLTDGTFDTIGQEGGMLAVATPYDAELAKVNAEIAAKTLYTGTAAVQAENRGRAAQMAELAPEAGRRAHQLHEEGRGRAGSGMAAPAASSAPVAVGGAVDLVEKPEALATVKDEELPAELQGLKKEEQAAKVKQLAAERKVLEEKAAKLASGPRRVAREERARRRRTASTTT